MGKDLLPLKEQPCEDPPGAIPPPIGFTYTVDMVLCLNHFN